MIEKIFTIARNTFIESLRQPVFVVVLVAVMMLQIMALLYAAYTFDSDTMAMIEMGLSMIFLGGLVLAVFTASSVLTREIHNKTVLTVISKPIGRPGFILGKYLGVTGAVMVAFWIWSLVFLLAARHKVMSAAYESADWVVVSFGFGALAMALVIAVWGNFFYGWVFASRFTIALAVCLTGAFLMVLLINKDWEFQSLAAEFTKKDSMFLQYVLALACVLQGVVVLCAAAICCSTRLGQVLTLVICLGVFFMGLSSDYLFGRHADSNPVARVLHTIFYNVQYTWLADALTMGHPVSGAYMALLGAYTALWVAVLLSLAVALFQTRETG